MLFLDEPTLGLDFDAQDAVRSFVRDYVRRHAATVPLTSHYLDDITSLASRVLIIGSGRIAYDGALGDLVGFEHEERVLAAFALNFLMQCVFGTLAFWLTMVRRVHGVWSGIGFFLNGGVTAWIFTFLVPIALITVFPAQAPLGELSIAAAGASVAAAALALALSTLVWRAALCSYEGASS